MPQTEQRTETNDCGRIHEQARQINNIKKQILRHSKKYGDH